MPSLCGHNEFVSALDSCGNSIGDPWRVGVLAGRYVLSFDSFPPKSVKDRYIAIITNISIVTTVHITKIIKET